MSEGSRQCTRCGETKPATVFSPDYRRDNKRVAQCTPCRVEINRERRRRNPTRAHEVERRSLLKRKYGITPEEYNARLEKQGGGCAICGSKDGGGRTNRFPVDHCHTTGVVRGLLCTKCNRGLGLFNDDVGRIRKAADYVERNR